MSDTMSDLISRQDALDALEKSRFLGAPYIDTGILIALQEIKALPSAQPESCEDAVSRQYAIEHYQHVCRRTNCKECPLHIQVTDTLTDCELELFLHNLPSVQPEPTLYGYPIEHLMMIARVMAKENCTPEAVAQMLQNAGEIAKMVRDEMMEMLKESIERSCKGVANEE